MGELAKVIDAEIVTIDAAARSHNVDPAVFRQFVMDGDISQIPRPDRPALVMALCQHIGIDPIERPFMVLHDGKREVLYATRSCTSALCRERKIDRKLIGVEERTIAGQKLIVAHARAALMATGRSDEATGVVPVMQEDVEWVNGPNGRRKKVHKGWRMPNPAEAANLVMKAETKAKRRAVLDLVGLGITDESELDTIAGARVAQIDLATGELHYEQPAALGAGEASPKASQRGDLGPRCSGKSAGLADGNDRRLGELAELVGRPKGNTWRAAIKHAGLDLAKYEEADGEPPRDPSRLTVEDGKALREWLDSKLEAKRADMDQSVEGGSQNADHDSQPANTDQLKRWVIDEYRRLCEKCDWSPEAWRDEFAAWAKLDSWPDTPTREHWVLVWEALRSLAANLEAVS